MSQDPLQQQFEELSQVLVDTSKLYVERDWNQRVNALRRAQELIQSQSSNPNLPKIFLKFTAQLSVQLQDLRSAIVKEASQTAQLCSEILGQKFEICAEKLFDTLFKMLNSGTKTISEYGHETIVKLLQNTITWRWVLIRTIPKIIEPNASKNPNIRVKSAQYLQFILENYPSEILLAGSSQRSNLMQLVQNAIKSNVQDASAEARAAGRKSFRALSERFPELSQQVYASLDSYAQRILQEELGSAPSPTTPKKAMPKPRQPQRPQARNVPPAPLPPTNAQFTHPVPSIETSSKKEDQFNKSVPSKFHKNNQGQNEQSRRMQSTEGRPKQETEIRPPSATSSRSRGSDANQQQSWIEIIVDKTYNTTWSIRLNAFERLVSQINNEQAISLIENNSAMWDKIITSHLDHMNDTHFKVASACLASLNVITELFPEKVSFALENLIPKLLNNLIDTNEGVVQSANELLETIMDIYMAEDLLTLFMRFKTIDNKMKFKSKVIEVVTLLLSSQMDWLDDINNIKTFIRKICQLIQGGQSARQLLIQAGKTLKQVLQYNQQATVNTIYDLHDQEIQIAQTILQSVGINLEGQVQRPQQLPQPTPNTEQGNKQLINGILRQLRGTGAVRYDGIKKIQNMNENIIEYASQWQQNFQQIIASLIECLQDESLAIRDFTLKILVKIVQNQTESALDHLSAILKGLVEALHIEERQMIQATEEALNQILSHFSIDAYLNILMDFTRQSDTPALQSLIRTITSIVKQAQEEDVLLHVRGIVDMLKQSFNHPNAEVRKSVVFCFVEIHFKLGDVFDEFLQELSASHKKLVTIYIQRRLDTQY